MALTAHSDTKEKRTRKNLKRRIPNTEKKKARKKNTEHQKEVGKQNNTKHAEIKKWLKVGKHNALSGQRERTFF